MRANEVALRIRKTRRNAIAQEAHDAFYGTLVRKDHRSGRPTLSRAACQHQLQFKPAKCEPSGTKTLEETVFEGPSFQLRQQHKVNAREGRSTIALHAIIGETAFERALTGRGNSTGPSFQSAV